MSWADLVLEEKMYQPSGTAIRIKAHEPEELGAWFTVGPHNEYSAQDLWRQNGGSPTYRELLYHRAPHERNMILHFLASLPDHLDIVVGTQMVSMA